MLDAAGGLLDAWCATAAERGVDLAGPIQAASGPNGSPSSPWRSPRPCTPEEATALLDAVVTRLAERGVSTHRDVLHVPLPRTDTTPRLRRVRATAARGRHRHRPQLGTGHRPADASPVVEMVGRCDETGIDAMLDLAITVNTGVFGNGFCR